MTPTRLAHFSDLHVAAPARWRPADYFGKRASAWVNLRLLGRGRRFRDSERVLAALREDLRQRRPDHLVFSGDASNFGFDAEVERAASLLPLDLPGLAVPGNHDYCTRAAARFGAFERRFAAWQAGERVGDNVYPFARRAGGLWLVGVCSAASNRLPWDARGRVGAAQLGRLRALLARLDGGPRVLVTHYPIARASGRPEAPMRGLRDLPELLAVAREGGVGLWLHGHRHDAYAHADTAIPSLCAGSATQRGHWSYGEYAVTATRVEGTRREYHPGRGRFVPTEAFAMRLGEAAP